MVVFVVVNGLLPNPSLSPQALGLCELWPVGQPLVMEAPPTALSSGNASGLAAQLLASSSPVGFASVSLHFLASPGTALVGSGSEHCRPLCRPSSPDLIITAVVGVDLSDEPSGGGACDFYSSDPHSLDSFIATIGAVSSSSQSDGGARHPLLDPSSPDPIGATVRSGMADDPSGHGGRVGLSIALAPGSVSADYSAGSAEDESGGGACLPFGSTQCFAAKAKSIRVITTPSLPVPSVRTARSQSSMPSMVVSALPSHLLPALFHEEGTTAMHVGYTLGMRMPRAAAHLCHLRDECISACTWSIL